MLKYFRGAPLKIYLHEYLTHRIFSYTKISRFMVVLVFHKISFILLGSVMSVCLAIFMLL